ncbi:hypothetical protein B0J12DRAFT_702560 [Macrophomina phaseolina]|uniref:Uncharacterized protein n=1 Tax=Macrophomina phaseolina TaxID=35725 RepID=A0ABQ8G1N3_9PEZI|nr:hypothetical protein B0J12DRAFT_702560 [Macrophomina phaseolina]
MPRRPPGSFTSRAARSLSLARGARVTTTGEAAAMDGLGDERVEHGLRSPARRTGYRRSVGRPGPPTTLHARQALAGGGSCPLPRPHPPAARRGLASPSHLVARNGAARASGALLLHRSEKLHGALAECGAQANRVGQPAGRLSLSHVGGSGSKRGYGQEPPGTAQVRRLRASCVPAGCSAPASTATPKKKILKKKKVPTAGQRLLGSTAHERRRPHRELHGARRPHGNANRSSHPAILAQLPLRRTPV